MPRVVLTNHDRSSLTAIASRLEASANSLRAIAELMDEAKMESIEVTRNDQLTRGMNYIEEFTHAARQAYYKLQEEAGVFRGRRRHV